MSVETNFWEVANSVKAMELSYYWKGYGSAIFLEFGELTERFRKDGTPSNSQGQITVGIEWSWRVEDKTSIICGSWDEEELWQPTFDKLIGNRIKTFNLFGQLPEIELIFETDLRVLSFATTKGQPGWMVIDKRSKNGHSFGVTDGILNQD